jgi:signal transduction histidine kinase
MFLLKKLSDLLIIGIAKKREACYISLVEIVAIVCLLVLLAPSDACAFVLHDYPATFINEAARIYFLLACILVLWAMRRNKLQTQPGWRFTFMSLICFIIWDAIVFSGQITASRVDPSHFIGSNSGWEYFRQKMILHGVDYFYYFANFDYLFIDTAMFFFYRGLREHLAEENKASSAPGALILPLMPLFGVSFIGTVIFIVLSVCSLAMSLKLYKRNRQNILWNYMIWLSSTFVLFSVSRSAGHVVEHILTASGHSGIWKNIEPISGSINIISLFIVGSITVFFIPIYDIYLEILADKKEIAKINVELTELNQELEDIVAERTMSLMALTVADKVRNPAAIIGIICRRMLKNREEDECLNRELSDVFCECEKLQNVVGDFENLLKSRRSQFTYEDINDIVREVIVIAAREAEEKGAFMEVNLSEKPVKINMQKSLLRVAIFHVLKNAIDASPAGGPIRITTATENGAVAIIIADSGMGIKTHDLEKIFDIFYSTKRKGFGMGLPLVKQIVTEHLGEVKIESKFNNGATVTMTFPSRWTM